MLSVRKMMLIELVFVVATLLVMGLLSLVGVSWDSADTIKTVMQFCNNVLQLNTAITIAFLISLITGKAFVFKDRNMKKIAKNSTLLFIINSAVITLYVFLGKYCMLIVVPPIACNLIKFYDISKNLLCVL